LNPIDLRETLLRELMPRAGSLALASYRSPDLVAEAKGVQDVVTAADRDVEALLTGRIREVFPEDGFIGEEGGERAPAPGGAVWVIDPIDGTANFARGLPLWCVSVGVLFEGTIVLGAIFDPVGNELFFARKGRGATRNGTPIRVSDRTDVGRARIGLGFSYRRPPELHVAAVAAMLDQGCEYSRLGSGALGLAYVADGRFEGYWEAHINAWDVAAGILLVEEAGGWVSDFLAGDGLHHGNPILASIPALVPFFRSALKEP
jgi:myo-inositol-1(or 4)-monophosphatase